MITIDKQGVSQSHCGLAIKNNLNAKEEELWKLKYLFHHAKI
jgi:hypothetical protein